MISKLTAAKIYNCYHEIEKANKLIQDLKDTLEKTGELKLKDSWGEQRGLQLGVPFGDSSTSLYQVQPDIALSVIEAHISAKQSEMERLKVSARIELYETKKADWWNGEIAKRLVAAEEILMAVKKYEDETKGEGSETFGINAYFSKAFPVQVSDTTM